VEAGHRVQIPADVRPSLRGAADDVHFAHACTTQQIILTYNAVDFLRLHKQHPDHYGILAVYQDNDSAKDMTYADIVRAIANLEYTGVSIAGGFWSLNAYRW
jgi:hypothetical protein